MSRLNIAISLDGFVAGPNQSEQDPLGEGGVAFGPPAAGSTPASKLNLLGALSGVPVPRGAVTPSAAPLDIA